MEELTPIEIKTLKLISKHPNGLEHEAIISKIGKDSECILNELKCKNLISQVYTFENDKPVPTNKWGTLDKGELFLVQYKSISKKNFRAKWGERIFGIIIGIAIGILVGYVLFMNKWN